MEGLRSARSFAGGLFTQVQQHDYEHKSTMIAPA